MSFSSTFSQQLGFAYGLHDASFEFPQQRADHDCGSQWGGEVDAAGDSGGAALAVSRIVHVRRQRKSGSGPSASSRGRVAFLPQSVRLEFPFTAEEVVLMGRTPYASGWFQTDEDRSAAEEAMTTTDTLAFRGRDFRTLSGGEAQRVILASALTQRPEVLLLDEPATHLDLRHQLSLYRLLGELAKSLLVVAVTHDLNLALQFSDRVMVLEDGRIAGMERPQEVLNPALIARVFGVQATVHGE